ncbi:hypothetical protein P9112_004104 [Eukaryota sp. TZLM1-RC]
MSSQNPIGIFFDSLRVLSKSVNDRVTELKQVYEGVSDLCSSKSPLYELKSKVISLNESIDKVSSVVFQDPLSDIFDGILQLCTSTDQSISFISSQLTDHDLPPPPEFQLPNQQSNPSSDAQHSDSDHYFDPPTPCIPSTPSHNQPSPAAQIETPTLDDLGLSDLAIGAIDGNTSSSLPSQPLQLNIEASLSQGTSNSITNNESQLNCLDHVSDVEYDTLPSFVRSCVDLNQVNEAIINLNASIGDSIFQSRSFLPSQMSMRQLMEAASIEEHQSNAKILVLALVKLNRIHSRNESGTVLYILNN